MMSIGIHHDRSGTGSGKISGNTKILQDEIMHNLSKSRTIQLLLMTCMLTVHLIDRIFLLAPFLPLPCSTEIVAHPIHANEHPSTTEATTAVPTDGGGLFYCGYPSSAVGRAIFPEYAQRYEGGFDWNTHQKIGVNNAQRNATSNDILLFGMHGPCSARLEDFPGKVLVINGEPGGGDTTKNITLEGKKLSDDIYQIGSVPDDGKNTALVYFFAFSPFLKSYFTAGDKSTLRNLYDHNHKPINTGKYNAMVYTNSACHRHREEAVNEISAIIPIHLGGQCRGARPTKGNYTRMRTPRREWARNFEVQTNYKFCFAMENSHPYQHHYITEKILNPFLAGCIPVYYGTPDVFDVFNRKAMVYYDPDNPAPALKQLKELYQNETLYNETLYNQPILAHGNETLRKYFSLVDDIEGGYLKQSLRTTMGV